MIEIYQQILEKGRRIDQLDNVLVEKINQIVQANKKEVLEFGQEVTIEFDIYCIPEELRDLFKERKNIIAGKGKIFNHEVQEKKYFYYKNFRVGERMITIQLIKTW